MKTVYFIRHAKSSWDNATLRDVDRPLNNRGQVDAPFMAKFLKKSNIRPDKLISSPARRAFTTATYFADVFGIAESDILIVDQLYEAAPDTVLEIVRNLDANWSTVFVYGHNPTFTDVVNLFSEKFILNVPTCGIARVDDPTGEWAKFGGRHARLTAFHYPKQFII